jgi:hypothetical protein
MNGFLWCPNVFIVIPMVPNPAPSQGIYMSKYSPYGVERPIVTQQMEEDEEEQYASGRNVQDAYSNAAYEDSYAFANQNFDNSNSLLGIESSRL